MYVEGEKFYLIKPKLKYINITYSYIYTRGREGHCLLFYFLLFNMIFADNILLCNRCTRYWISVLCVISKDAVFVSWAMFGMMDFHAKCVVGVVVSGTFFASCPIRFRLIFWKIRTASWSDFFVLHVPKNGFRTRFRGAKITFRMPFLGYSIPDFGLCWCHFELFRGGFVANLGQKCRSQNAIGMP